MNRKTKSHSVFALFSSEDLIEDKRGQTKLKAENADGQKRLFSRKGRQLRVMRSGGKKDRQDERRGRRVN